MNFRTVLQQEIAETERRLGVLRAAAAIYLDGVTALPWREDGAAPTPLPARLRCRRPGTKTATICATAERMIRARGMRPVTSAEVLEELERAGLKLEARDKISYIGAILSQAGDITYRHPLGWTMQNLGVVA